MLVHTFFFYRNVSFLVEFTHFLFVHAYFELKQHAIVYNQHSINFSSI